MQAKTSSQSKSTVVLDFLTSWPASGTYYVRDWLRYRPNLEQDFRASLEAQVAKNPDAVIGYGNPRDRNSSIVYCGSNGKGGRIRIPSSEYYANEEYYRRLSRGEE